MIGVISKDSEIKVVQEFFELFKTPWEFYVPQHVYDMVIATSDLMPTNPNAPVLAIYNSRRTEFDQGIGMATQLRQKDEWLECDGVEFPVYGDESVFHPAEGAFLRRRGKPDIVGVEVNESTCRVMRVGYDLFQEISFLLSRGQPRENAHIPTLEIHISLLRRCMLNAGISFVEIPPVPGGYDFMACLTHDVDFTGIRKHKFDQTMWGFVYRALVGSLIDALRGRMAWSKLRQNWKAVFSLPLVHLGLQEDFWLEFDRYLQIESGLGSTFYFLPFKDFAGEQDSGAAPKRRAAKYDVTEIKEQVRELLRSGCEIGLHGIDAWRGAQKAREERSRIYGVTGQPVAGVRMHWLYFDKGSPKALQEAGFSYDSSFGYNNAVGFRGGTTQVFCPTFAGDLFELSLNIQDTAMFYPSRMNLTETQALDMYKLLIGSTATFGGALTVNWHTRSLSPERLWGDSYVSLLNQIRNKCVWFGTAEEIVTWFRNRRAFRFEQAQSIETGLQVRITGPAPDGLPPFLVRTHHPTSRFSTETAFTTLGTAYSDTPWRGETELKVAW